MRIVSLFDALKSIFQTLAAHCKTSRQPLWHGMLTFSVLILLIISVSFWLARDADSSAKPANAALTVTSAVPKWRDWPATIEATGTIEPWQEAVIGAQLSGLRLTEVLVNVGDNVKQGQRLARFDDQMLKADMAQLQANLAQAKATARQAETNKQRILKLKDTGSISQQDILRYQTDATASRAQLEAVKAQIEAKQLQLQYADVLAPDDGVISRRQATLGAVAAAGQELFRLIRQNKLEWRGELTAQQMALSRPGQSVSLNLPDGSQAQAHLRQLAPALDPQSRLGIAYADLEPGSQARAGMYAAGKLLLSESPALTVPAASVVIRDGRSYVLKLQSNESPGLVSLQAVITGRRQNTEVEIIQGLSDSDLIVVEGAGFLTDGDLVRVVQPAGNGELG